ncbi:DUF2975 domain-containing protein [Streptosporangium canum]|uniref:DUF2975 domain-containing protein n=1 Tax=Streptosporangium canum TaxID=324952 RepID=UPI00341BA026
MPTDGANSLKWTKIIVRVLLVLFAGLMIYQVGHVALTGGVNAYGPGDSSHSLVCAPPPNILDVEGNYVEDPQRRKAVTAKEPVNAPHPPQQDDNPYPVEQGVEFYDKTVRVCKDDSSLGIQLLYQSSRFATPLVLLAALFLLDRLIGDARRRSGFEAAIVRRLRFLGVFLGAGTLATSIFTTLVETGLAVSMVASPIRNVWEMALVGWAFPWEFLIAGLGLVVMAKVVRVGAHMREELEGTV